MKQKDIPLSLKYDNFFIFHPSFSSSSSSSCSSLFSSLIIVLTFFFVILHYHRWIEGLEEFPLQLYPGLAQLMNRSSSDGKGDSDMSMILLVLVPFLLRDPSLLVSNFRGTSEVVLMDCHLS